MASNVRCWVWGRGRYARIVLFLLCCKRACRAGLFSDLMAAVRSDAQRCSAGLLRAVRACGSAVWCCCRWPCCRSSRAAANNVTTMEDIISEHRAVMEDLAGSTSLVGHAPPQRPRPRPCCCIGCTVQVHCCSGHALWAVCATPVTGGREVVTASRLARVPCARTSDRPYSLCSSGRPV